MKATDLNERYPFDVEICPIPPGKTPYPCHSHSAPWELYHVIPGRGIVRHQDGTTAIEVGDAFIFKPGEPHQITNDGEQDLSIAKAIFQTEPKGLRLRNDQAIVTLNPCRSVRVSEGVHDRGGGETLQWLPV